MAFLNWSEQYSVSVASIDKQHKKLFDMLNELHAAMKSGTGRQVAPAILNGLVAYTREHFASEESMMMRANYPDFANHKAEHEKLTGQVVRMVKDFEASGAVVSIKLMDFLGTWLREHIKNSDQKYTASMQAAGLR